MEANYWLESCGREQCPADERLEYCSQELKDSPDYIDEVVRRIDSLVEAKSIKSYKHRYTVDNESSWLQRNFETESAFSDEIALAGVRHSMEVRIESLQKPSRQIYSVICDWRIASDDYLSVPYSRSYTLELYKSGSAQCSVSEPDLSPQMNDSLLTYLERPMTPYDIRQLYNAVNQLTQIELADPDYVDSESYFGWTAG